MRTPREAAVSMIDLGRVTKILHEAEELIEELHGSPLDERAAVESSTAGEERKRRARQSQALNLLSDRLELAAALVRVEYWQARGYEDPTDGHTRLLTVEAFSVDGNKSDGNSPA